LYQLVREEAVEKAAGKPSEVAEVAMAVPALLLRSQKLHENLGLPPRQLIDWIAMCREVDESGLLDVIAVVYADGADLAERPFELTRPMRGLLRLSDERLAEPALRSLAAELEGDIDHAWRVPQYGDRGAKELRKVMEMGEVECVADRCLTSVVGAEEHAEATRERAREIPVRGSPKPPDGDRAEIHPL